MAGARSLRQLAAEERPLVTPVAHDALSARLIADAGFKAIAIGGSSMLAARYALPDLGLAALGEMVDGAREILAATDLPCIIDADDGYGDLKSVARTMEVYQRLGVAGVILEDQARDAKRPGDSQAKGLVPPEVAAAKLAVAKTERRDPDLLIIARTDSYGAEGLDGALRRGDRYLRAGADGIFIPAVTRPEEIERAGNAFRGAYQMIVMSEGGKTPWLKPAELHAMGYSQVAYPSFLVLRTTLAIARGLAELKAITGGAERPAWSEAAEARAVFQRAVRQRDWEAIETRDQGNA
jgi:2-methylisocitrate lyase-like PEP mutase family enzyme